MLVVTAASSNHSGALQQLLASLRKLDADVVCYDLGLDERQRRNIRAWRGLTLRRFDYSRYPEHLRIEVNAGEYAWKPVLVAETVEQELDGAAPRDVVWVDAGTYFHALGPLAARIRASGGVYVRASSGTIGEWTHPGMFAYLGEGMESYAPRQNADATLVGFALQQPDAYQRHALYQRLILPWRDCALARDCIAPTGSSRANHRQDQAVLSYLIHKVGYAFASDTSRDLGVRCKCDRWFYRYTGFNVPPALYARGCLY
jgi:hypothetical protein